MAKLTTKGRDKLKDNQFAIEGKRKYPVDTPARAANAKARATQMVNQGKLSPASKAKIDKKADRILGKNK